MNRYCAFAALLLLFSIASAASVYELHLVIYKNDTVGLKNFSIRDGSPGPFPDAGADNNYEFRIISADSNSLFSQRFHLGFAAYRFRGPNSTEPDVVYYNKTDDYWRLPYFRDAAKIQLFHEDKMIFEYILSEEKKQDADSQNNAQNDTIMQDSSKNATEMTTQGTTTTQNVKKDEGIDVYLIFSYAFATFVVLFVIYKIFSKPKK